MWNDVEMYHTLTFIVLISRFPTVPSCLGVAIYIYIYHVYVSMYIYIYVLREKFAYMWNTHGETHLEHDLHIVGVHGFPHLYMLVYTRVP